MFINVRRPASAIEGNVAVQPRPHRCSERLSARKGRRVTVVFMKCACCQHKPLSAYFPFVFQPRSLLSAVNGSGSSRLSSGCSCAGRGSFCVYGITSPTWHSQRQTFAVTSIPAIRARWLLSEHQSDRTLLLWMPGRPCGTSTLTLVSETVSSLRHIWRLCVGVFLFGSPVMSIHI